MVKLRLLRGGEGGAGHTVTCSARQVLGPELRWARPRLPTQAPPIGGVPPAVAARRWAAGVALSRWGPQERAGRGPGFPGGASCHRNEESWEQVMKPQPGLREAACPAGLAPHLPLTSAFSAHAGLWVPVQRGGPSRGTSRELDVAWHSAPRRPKLASEKERQSPWGRGRQCF